MTSKPKKRIIVLADDADDYQELARTLLNQAMDDPEKWELIERVVTNETLTAKQVFSTAFSVGVVAAVYAMRQGKIKMFPKG